VADELVKYPRVDGTTSARADARLPVALALTALVGTIVLLMPDIALAATTRPSKTWWSALVAVVGLTVFFLGLSALAFAIYLATRRAWVAIGVPMLAVFPFSAIFQWQNPAIVAPSGKLFAVVGTVLAVGLLATAGVGLARLLAKEASRIGTAATALATAIPLVLGVFGPVIAGTLSQLPPQAGLNAVDMPVVVSLVALALPLAWLSRSVAGTTIGTGAAFLVLSFWPVAVSTAVDAGQGMLVVFLLIPLIPVVLLLAFAGAKLASKR
jgi:hypothetical protein